MATRIIITIDGPAGAGKSTTARRVAEELGYVYIDTGAMYRAVTLAAIRSSADIDEEFVSQLAGKVNIHLQPGEKGQRTFLNGDDVTEAIRDPEVTQLVSSLRSYSGVRRHMVQLQRAMGINGGIVMDGRDIGSVVFPHAHVKVFLVADIDERTKRRAGDLRASGLEVDEAVLRQQIETRDGLDSGRDVSPLVKAEGATEIDTTSLSIDQQVQMIVDLAKSYLKTEGWISKFGGL